MFELTKGKNTDRDRDISPDSNPSPCMPTGSLCDKIEKTPETSGELKFAWKEPTCLKLLQS